MHVDRSGFDPGPGRFILFSNQARPDFRYLMNIHYAALICIFSDLCIFSDSVILRDFASRPVCANLAHVYNPESRNPQNRSRTVNTTGPDPIIHFSRALPSSIMTFLRVPHLKCKTLYTGPGVHDTLTLNVQFDYMGMCPCVCVGGGGVLLSPIPQYPFPDSLRNILFSSSILRQFKCL